MTLSIFGGIIVTNDTHRRVIKDGVVNIEGTQITEIGSAAEIKPSGDLKINAHGGIIIPGLVCTHDHAYGVMTHGMGFPQNWFPMPSFAEAILDWWWPAVEDILTKEDVRVGVQASCLESVKTGTTTIIDILEAPNSVPGVLEVERDVLDPLGIRAVLSLESSERISKKNGETALQENLGFIKKFNRPDARIRGMHCIHTSFSCSTEMIQRAREMANQEKAGIQIHLEEGKYEGMWSHVHNRKTPVEYYDSLGFWGPDVLASQAVHPTPKERAILAKHNVHISHQPVSNCEGGHGFAPVVDMLNRGLTIGLGSDGVVLDLFEVMRMAHFIHKAVEEDATVMPAHTVFEMATLHGAKCALQSSRIGSLEIGKKADVVVMQPKLPTPINTHNVLDQITLYCSGRDVTHTIIDGQIVVEDGIVQTIDEAKARDQMAKQIPDYWGRTMEAMNAILQKK